MNMVFRLRMPSQQSLRTRAGSWLPALLAGSVVVAGCSGSSGGVTAPGQASQNGCNFTVSAQPQALSATDVEKIIAQGVQAASLLGARATLAVVDRSGNVLAVYKMNGAQNTVTTGTTSNKPAQGLEGLNGLISSETAAIAKSITGAYLSSSGNAFSTRTASYIVQNHFAPGILGTPGGPLFGVQFSQLPCGDLVTRGDTDSAGPKRSPLGISADPGGFPLYKNGQVVGGVGVIADGNYGLDQNPSSDSGSVDEQIAQSALSGFEASSCIRADRISVGGLTLPYTSSDGQLVPVTVTALNDPLIATLGGLSSVPFYYDSSAIHAGVAYGSPASGFVADTGVFASLNGVDLVDSSAANRFPPTSSPLSGTAMTQSEVQAFLTQALVIANQTRAQIRVPAGSAAQITVTVVDNAGTVLGLVRSADAPIFGIDVALQKARTAAFFSSAQAAAMLTAQAPVAYLGGTGFPTGVPFTLGSVYLSGQATSAIPFFNNPGIFSDGVAFSVRAIGNVSRPNFPDGIDTDRNGPFSKPLAQWTIFNDGLQLDLVYNGFIQSVIDASNPNNNCTGTGQAGATSIAMLKNGIQIFAGGFPIYRGATLVGGIGVSGDGVEQDDMIGFLAVANAGRSLGTGLGHASPSIRADTLLPQGQRLTYVQCPVAPFNNSDAQDVCAGI